MAILNIDEVKSKGFSKGIDEESMPIVSDMLQCGIYTQAIPSTIRETVSNCFDSIKNKNRGLAILAGKERVEDHYNMDLKDGIYHASGFDPTYYSSEHLSDDDNIYIRHIYEGRKDTLVIKDHGTGLGGKNLLGYFKLAWSSKRADKGALGKWGLGSKVAFSLKIQSYIVVNTYNGYEMTLEVLKDDVNPITPKFSRSGGVNERILIVEATVENVNGELVEVKPAIYGYREKTTKKNGLELRIPTNVGDRDSFVQAIKQQLGYIPGVKFETIQNGVSTQHDVTSKVYFESKNFIVSSPQFYSKPHILLGTKEGYINYGYINFDELNLDNKAGSVGIILNINDVDVPPNRESVIWSPKTREAVLESYNKLTTDSNLIIKQKLDTITNYFEWYKFCANLKISLSNQNSGVVRKVDEDDDNFALFQLASMTEIENLDFSFKGNKDIPFNDNMAGGEFNVRTFRNKNLESFSHTDANNKILYCDSNYSRVVAKYLFSKHGNINVVSRSSSFVRVGTEHKSDLFSDCLDELRKQGIVIDQSTVDVPDTFNKKVALEDELEEEEKSGKVKKDDGHINYSIRYPFAPYFSTRALITPRNLIINVIGDYDRIILVDNNQKSFISKVFHDSKIEDYQKENESIIFLCIAKDDAQQFRELGNIVSFEEGLIERYNKRTGHLVFHEYFRNRITHLFISSVFSGRSIFKDDGSISESSKVIQDLGRTIYKIKAIEESLVAEGLETESTDVFLNNVGNINPERYRILLFGDCELGASLCFFLGALVRVDLDLFEERYSDVIDIDACLEIVDRYIPDELCFLDKVNSVEIIDRDQIDNIFRFGRILEKYPEYTNLQVRAKKLASHISATPSAMNKTLLKALVDSIKEEFTK